MSTTWKRAAKTEREWPPCGYCIRSMISWSGRLTELAGIVAPGAGPAATTVADWFEYLLLEPPALVAVTRVCSRLLRSAWVSA